MQLDQNVVRKVFVRHWRDAGFKEKADPSHGEDHEDCSNGHAEVGQELGVP